MVEYCQSFTKKQFILFLINQNFKEIFSNLFFHTCIASWLMWLTWEENRKIVITQQEWVVLMTMNKANVSRFVECYCLVFDT